MEKVTPIRNMQPATPKRSPVKEITSGLDENVKAFLKSRNISEDTGRLFGLVKAVAFFPDLKEETLAVAFPYMEGKKIEYKIRSLKQKAFICSKALTTLFGINLVDLSESGDLIICEGEIDPISMYEAGVMNATSVPNGAQSFGTGDDDRPTHGFLWNAKEQIDKATRIIIATDADEKGEKLAEELARRIGRHRCWTVEWPEGCKDANDVLMRFGGDILAACVANAKPWPIAGLYEAERYFNDVTELYENGFGSKVKTGMSAVDDIYSVGKGLLTVVTGIPANGKSTFVDQLMINLARTKGYVSAICSFENPPKVHMAKLSEMLLHKHFFVSDKPGVRMTTDELHSTYGFINRHFKFLQQEDGAKSTIESIIERIKTAVFRWGIQCAVIDPFNYIERPKTAENETQFIDDILTHLKLLAQAYDLHIWFVAHPTKMPMDADGRYSPPRGYSISGSAAWYSKSDFGLTIHKNPDMPGEVKVINWKTRFNWLGKEGEVTILYDNTKNIYISDVMLDLLPWEGEENEAA